MEVVIPNVHLADYFALSDLDGNCASSSSAMHANTVKAFWIGEAALNSTVSASETAANPCVSFDILLKAITLRGSETVVSKIKAQWERILDEFRQPGVLKDLASAKLNQRICQPRCIRGNYRPSAASANSGK